MSGYNGSGIWVVSGAGLPYTSNTTISSTVANTFNTDLATGLSTAICKDGQSTPTANIPLGGFKLTNVGAATLAGDALTYTAGTAWTPTDASGASLTFTGVSANYVLLGNLVFAYFQLVYPATADGSNSLIGGLPFTAANADYAQQGGLSFANNSSALVTQARVIKNTKTIQTYGGSGTRNSNAQMSLITVAGLFIYPLS